jgi:hypothetical protein
VNRGTCADKQPSSARSAKWRPKPDAIANRSATPKMHQTRHQTTLSTAGSAERTSFAWLQPQMQRKRVFCAFSCAACKKAKSRKVRQKKVTYSHKKTEQSRTTMFLHSPIRTEVQNKAQAFFLTLTKCPVVRPCSLSELCSC